MYKVRKRGRWHVVIDNTEQGPYDRIGNLMFSPDSENLVYKAKKDGRWFVVLGGTVAGKEYDEIGFQSIVFSPDGKRIAYRAQEGVKWRVVVDNQEGELYDALIQEHGNPFICNRIVFDSPDSLYYLSWKEDISSVSIYRVVRTLSP